MLKCIHTFYKNNKRTNKMSSSSEIVSASPTSAGENTVGFEVAGAMEFGQPQTPVSAESRITRALRSVAEGAYKIGDKLHDVADGRESKNTTENESSQESPQVIFRGLGRSARKAMIGARVNLAVGKVKLQETVGVVSHKASSLTESATATFNTVKNKVNSFGAPKRDPMDVSDLVRNSESGKTFHRPNGKFMSSNELEAVRAHQDQIREGMRVLNGTKEPNIIDNIKRNTSERVDSLRSSVEDFLFDIADRIREKKDAIKSGLTEKFSAKKADVISEYRAARDIIGNSLLEKVNNLNQYFADRKSEAEARKAARVQNREQARAERARNRQIDNRVVNAEVSRRLENREARTIDPAEARRRGRMATRAAALASAVRVGVATGRETYDVLK
jgi:hypothetical protein